jgi:pimeloyl-ACP methyl ester carboxylesterase
VSLVRVPGARIWVEESGSGVPVVLVHGGTGTAEHDWGPVIPQLRSRYRVVVMDLRGHGRSHDPDYELGITRFGLDLVHIMRALGLPRAVLVGFSVGANTLLKLVSARPDLALGLVTIGASVAGDASRVPQILSGPWPLDLINLHHHVGDGPDYWQRLRIALAHDWANNLLLTDTQLRQITCPTLICHGDRDRVSMLDEALHLYRTIPRSQLFVAPGSGHQLQLEKPQLFIDAMDAFVSTIESPVSGPDRLTIPSKEHP